MLKFIVLSLCGFAVIAATERAVSAGRRRLRLAGEQDGLDAGAARRRRTLTILVVLVSIAGVVFAGSLPLFPLIAGDRPTWHPLRKSLDLVQGTAIAVFVIGGIVMGHKIRAIDAASGKSEEESH